MAVNDVVSGSILAALGIAVAAYGAANYELGTLRAIGPGMLPFVLSCLLAVLGIGTGVVGALTRKETSGHGFNLRQPGFILGGMSFFAATVALLGILPATFALVLIVTYADGRLRFWQVCLLAASIAAVVVGVFRLGLQVRLPLAPPLGL